MWCGLCISLHCFQLFTLHTRWLCGVAFASLCIVSSCLQYTHNDSCLIWYYILPLSMWCGLCISLHCFQLFTIHTQWLVFNMVLYTTIECVVWPLHLSALFQLFTIHTQWLVFNMVLYTTIEYVVWPLHLSALLHSCLQYTHNDSCLIWYYILLSMWCDLCISLHCFQLFTIHTRWLVFNMVLYTTIEYVVWPLHLSALFPAVYNTHTMTRV